MPSAPYARVLRRRHLRGAALVVVAAAALAVPAVAGALARASSLHVAISVPSVLSSNGRQVWVANTGTSSVLELTANGGREVLDVKGAKLRLDNSDAIAQYGNDVWVANAASDTVTEFYAKSGALKHVLAGPKFHFAVPLTLVAADRHVFVLATAGDKVTEVNETSGRLVRYLQGARFHFHAATAMTRAGDNVWVVSTGGGGSLTELSAATGGVERVVAAKSAHLDRPVAISTDGAELLVANSAGGHLSLLNARTGAFSRTVTSSTVNLNHVASIALSHGIAWVASTTSPAFVAGIRVANGATVHVFRHRFGFPTVFSDGTHVWVVDRLQSNVTELVATTGHVVRVVNR